MTKSNNSSKQNYNYPVIQEMTMPHRVAHFLDWVATREPGSCITYHNIVRAVMGYGPSVKVPTSEIHQLRDRMHRVGQILREKYKRELYMEPGFGARATKDSEDLVENVLSKRTRRLVSARNSVDASLQLVEGSKLRSPRLKAFHQEVVTTIGQLNDNRITKLLLPPAPTPAPLFDVKAGKK